MYSIEKLSEFHTYLWEEFNKIYDNLNIITPILDICFLYNPSLKNKLRYHMDFNGPEKYMYNIHIAADNCHIVRVKCELPILQNDHMFSYIVIFLKGSKYILARYGTTDLSVTQNNIVHYFNAAKKIMTESDIACIRDADVTELILDYGRLLDVSNNKI